MVRGVQGDLFVDFDGGQEKASTLPPSGTCHVWVLLYCFQRQAGRTSATALEALHLTGAQRAFQQVVFEISSWYPAAELRLRMDLPSWQLSTCLVDVGVGFKGCCVSKPDKDPKPRSPESTW